MSTSCNMATAGETEKHSTYWPEAFRILHRQRQVQTGKLQGYIYSGDLTRSGNDLGYWPRQVMESRSSVDILGRGN